MFASANVPEHWIFATARDVDNAEMPRCRGRKTGEDTMGLMRIFGACAAALALAGCDGIAIANAPADQIVIDTPTVQAPMAITGVTPQMLPQAIVTGPALDLNWTDRYQANVAYVNTGALPIPVYSGPDGQDVVARLSPGNGGGIDACAVEVDMCSVAFGAPLRRGWVFMETMAPAPAS